ncbi:hypothetical protein [Nocardioides sp. Kera G14]|uniref:hypothetical protein n=1 Tax=Nocardioides sp. Kera G14 TaxID=2884264 RepID=UPI001D11BBA0|nr:hypothetical protein [Nocardioides sp. Kera G14]UDY23758.1 hypothetical protein LH076_00220 [Nocardioides sp. Kera G14]
MDLLPMRSGRLLPPRRRNSALVRRRRAFAGLLISVVGAALIGFGTWANTVDEPDPVRVTVPGRTALPEIHFFQNTWVLYAAIPDRRHPPSLSALGCSLRGATLPPHPADMSVYGSRVVDGGPILPAVFLGRPSRASLLCTDATTYGPLWAMPSTTVPPFTATAMIILGILFLVAAALLHPAVGDLPERITSWRRRATD